MHAGGHNGSIRTGWNIAQESSARKGEWNFLQLKCGAVRILRTLLQLTVGSLVLNHVLKIDGFEVLRCDRSIDHSGECISWSVVSTADMMDVRSKLCHKVQVSCLSGRVMIVMGMEREGEQLMTGEYVKFSAFYEVPKVLDGQVHSSPVTRLWGPCAARRTRDS